MAKPRFDDLVWQEDLVLIDGVGFELYEGFDSPPKLGPDTFWLFKGRELMDEYLSIFQRYPDLEIRNLFEIGIWESGSVAFWTECFQPVKHVAIDLAAPREPAYFRRFLRERDLKTRVRTFWQTDQADGKRLLDIARREFDGPLDLVIDDASHRLEPTKASLVTLFPLLREGGIFIVEDWAWHLVPEVRRAFTAAEPGLVPLINQLMSLLRDEPTLLAAFDLRERLFVLERGPMPESEARERLARRVSPRYNAGPPLIRRMVRSSVLWRLARSAVRRRRG